MKLVKIFAALVLVVIILYFLLQNTNPVDVDLVFVQKRSCSSISSDAGCFKHRYYYRLWSCFTINTGGKI